MSIANGVHEYNTHVLQISIIVQKIGNVTNVM